MLQTISIYILTVLVITVSVCAQEAEVKNQSLVSMLQKVVDEDLMSKEMPNKQGARTAAFAAIDKACLLLPNLSLSAEELERARTDYSSLLTTAVYPQEVQSLQVEQWVLEIRNGLKNLVAGRLEGLNPERKRALEESNRYYLELVSKSLGNALQRCERIVVPTSLWEQYSGAMVSASLVEIGLPPNTDQQSSVNDKKLKDVVCPPTFEEASRFVHGRVLAYLVRLASVEQKHVNNVFVLTEDRISALATVDFSISKDMNDRLDAYVGLAMHEGAFVYDRELFDLFPHQKRMEQDFSSLLEKNRKRIEATPEQKEILEGRIFAKSEQAPAVGKIDLPIFR